MKSNIIKIWVCRECEKEYVTRPIVCSMCNNFEFFIKYGGEITDAEELSKLIESYKEDDQDKNKRVRM